MLVDKKNNRIWRLPKISNQIIDLEKKNQPMLTPTGDMLGNWVLTQHQSIMAQSACYLSTKYGNHTMEKQNIVMCLLMLKPSMWISPLSFGANFQLAGTQNIEKYISNNLGKMSKSRIAKIL